MGSEQINTIVILGTGNVATCLAHGLQLAGTEILQIYGRNIAHAKELAAMFDTKYTDDTEKINSSADLYIVCINDDAIEAVIKKIPPTESLIVHTSGTTSIEVFDDRRKNFGIFYPLQTFSKEKKIDFKDIPICIEANTNTNKQLLVALAKRISNNVHLINSEQRRTLHIGAVFASNFTNYFYSIASEILADKKLSFDLLKPLIHESANKIIAQKPIDVQTGPAQRGDDKIIDEHIKTLADKPEHKELYEQISKLIKHKYLGQ